jgi:hypothetical protein
MTRITRIFAATNWRYAIGEVVLIVVGILIALAAADWNDRRLLRGEELALLDELRSGLQQDLVTVEAALEQVLGAEKQLMALQEVLADPQPYDPSMDELFGVVYGTRIVFLNTATYETLKSVGLQTVSNDTLRLGIAHMFDQSYALMLMNNDIDMAINLDLLRPYYLQNFRELKIGISATPISYEALIADPYYRNIVDYRLTVLRNNRITSYTAIIDDMRDLLAMLDDELGHDRG